MGERKVSSLLPIRALELLTVDRFLTAVFKHAMSNQPAMILIDEMEALTYSRNETDTASTKAIVSTLLSQWTNLQHDGASVFVIGATNLPHRIDPAFLRRLELKLYVRGPGKTERVPLFMDALAGCKHNIPFDQGTHVDGLETLVEMSRVKRLTGCDIKMYVNMAVKATLAELWTAKAFVRVCDIVVHQPGFYQHRSSVCLNIATDQDVNNRSGRMAENTYNQQQNMTYPFLTRYTNAQRNST